MLVNPIDSASGTLSAVGLSHEAAPASVRSLFALNQASSKQLFYQAKEAGIKELFVLSTCNRTEVFGWETDHSLLTELLLANVKPEAKKYRQLIYRLEKNHTIDHLFDVSVGLKSQILGDFEIIGQIKSCFLHAKKNGITGARTERLINTLVKASRKVKLETFFSSGTSSVAYAAVKYVLNHFPEKDKKKIILLGTGKIGLNTCSNLKKYDKNSEIILINRTLEKAEKAAKKFSVQVKPFANLNAEIQNCDVIIVSTASSEPMIRYSAIKANKKLLIIDLSIPSNVDEQLATKANISVVNVDKISRLQSQTLKKRVAEIPQVKKILSDEKSTYLEWLDSYEFAPFLRALKGKLIDYSQSQRRTTVTETDKIIDKVVAKTAVHLKKDPKNSPMTIALFQKIFQLDAIEN